LIRYLLFHIGYNKIVEINKRLLFRRSVRALFVFPGDTLATIEEFEGKEGTYESSGIIKASLMGKVVYDFKNRTIIVEPSSKNITFPKIGDIVIGLIIMTSANIIEMKILYINNKRKEVNLNAIYYGSFKGDTQFKVGDIVRARIVNILNAFIHVTFNDKSLGVLYTRCSLCGSETVKINHSLKCIECNNKEERKLAEDYGNIKYILPFYERV